MTATRGESGQGALDLDYAAALLYGLCCKDGHWHIRLYVPNTIAQNSTIWESLVAACSVEPYHQLLQTDRTQIQLMYSTVVDQDAGQTAEVWAFRYPQTPLVPAVQACLTATNSKSNHKSSTQAHTHTHTHMAAWYRRSCSFLPRS